MDEEVGARAQAKKKKAKKKKKKKKRKKAKKKKVRFPGGKRKKGHHKSPSAFLLDETNAMGEATVLLSMNYGVSPHSIGV